MWIVLLKDLVPTKMKLQAGSLTEGRRNTHHTRLQSKLTWPWPACVHTKPSLLPWAEDTMGPRKGHWEGLLWPGQQGPGVCSSDLIWEQQQKARLSMKRGYKPHCIFSCPIRLLTKHKFKDRLVKNLNTEATPSTGLFWTGSPKYCTDHTHRPCTCLDTEDYNYLTPPTDSC